MNFTKILPDIKNYLNLIFERYPIILKISNIIEKHNGQLYLVGGVVRDIILDIEFPTPPVPGVALAKTGRPELRLSITRGKSRDYESFRSKIKDIDIEVHNINLKDLEKILSQFGHVNLVGKIFGVLKLENIDIDWSLPRFDSVGRKPEVKIIEDLDIKTALSRRDLTINSMAINIVTGEFIDPFNGLEDIKNKILRSPDINFFKEDPLRFFRVMQFIGRFNMYPDKELNNICSSMNIKTVSCERIEKEFEKLILLSKSPSLGIRWLHDIERIKEILPELANTIGIRQEPSWHPEGDVFEHTMQALDACALLDFNTNYEKLICSYGALCHDLGKVNTTKIINNKITSYNHENTGVKFARSMLLRITKQKDLIKTVCALVANHMKPTAFIKNNAGIAAYKRLANILAAANTNIYTLSKVVLSDKRGRNGCGHKPLNIDIPDLDLFIKKSEDAQVFTGPEKPILLGRDITDLVKPGPDMGKYLKYIYQIQINKNIKDKEKLKKILKDKLK